MTATVVEPHEGSSLYYSLWRVDEQRRNSTLARLALGRDLQNALLDVQTPEVAHQKLHWWHEELDRLHAGNPRHPSTKACADMAADDHARQAALDVLGAAADERYTPPATTEALDTGLARGAQGMMSLCLGSLEGQAVNPLDDDLVPLATGLAHHHRLTRLSQLLGAGQPVLSTEQYQHHAIEPAAFADIADTDAEPARKALLADAINHTLGHLADGIANAEARWPRGAPARPALVLARLRERQLRAWTKRGTQLVATSYSLPPITKLWIAWRTR